MFQELSDLINKGIDSIFQDYPVIVWQLMATLVLLIFITVFFWKPITKFIENQDKEVNEKINEVDKLKEETLKIKKDSNLEYQKMKEEMTVIKKKLIEEANKKSDEIIANAISWSNKRKQDLQDELANDIIKQEEKIKDAIKEVAILAAEKIIGDNIEKPKSDIVDEIIEEIKDAKFK